MAKFDKGNTVLEKSVDFVMEIEFSTGACGKMREKQGEVIHKMLWITKKNGKKMKLSTGRC